MLVIHQHVRDANGQDWPQLLRMAYQLAKIDNVQPLALPDNAHFLVAENDEVSRDCGKLIGMVACHQPANGTMMLSHLFVDEQFRRRTGIGTALLKSAQAFAGPKTAIELAVSRSNKTARRFYRKNGFRLTDMMNLRLEATA